MKRFRNSEEEGTLKFLKRKLDTSDDDDDDDDSQPQRKYLRTN